MFSASQPRPPLASRPPPRSGPARRAGLSAAAVVAALCAAALLLGASARAHDTHQHGGGSADAACEPTTLACAKAVTPHVDARGRLWLVWTAPGGAVVVGRSEDGARSLASAVVVGRHGAALDGGADARPQLLVDAAGRVIVAYGVFRDQKYNAQVMLATSLDDGKTFSAPRSLSNDPASQRFPVLVPDRSGAVLIAWLDKRVVAAARSRGEAQPGAALAWAWTRDGGQSVEAEQLTPGISCECCRIAAAVGRDGHPVLAYRAIFAGGERDHALVRFDDQGRPRPATRVAEDHWAIEACPHQGPSLAVDGNGTVHTTWFTQGRARQGLFVARAVDGSTFDTPLAVGAGERQASRGTLVAHGARLWLAWQEFDGQRISVRWRRSNDGGATWSQDQLAADTGAAADQPVLVAERSGAGSRVMLSWRTKAEGLRWLPLDTLEQP